MLAHAHLLIVLGVVCLASFVAIPFALLFNGGRGAGKALLLALGALLLIGKVGP